MLISKPKQQQDLFAISNIGFIINSIQINFDELPIIYFANTIDNLKQSNNYDKRNYFFNDQFMTLDNIKKQINLLDMVTESYIKRLIEKYDSITEDKLIQFYIDYIYYLVDKLNLLGLPMNSIIDIKYSLLLKNSELLSLLNKYNSNIINNLKSLYSDLIKISK